MVAFVRVFPLLLIRKEIIDRMFLNFGMNNTIINGDAALFVISLSSTCPGLAQKRA